MSRQGSVGDWRPFGDCVSWLVGIRRRLVGRRHLHYNEITACLLYGIIPDYSRTLTTCQLIKNKLLLFPGRLITSTQTDQGNHLLKGCIPMMRSGSHVYISNVLMVYPCGTICDRFLVDVFMIVERYTANWRPVNILQQPAGPYSAPKFFLLFSGTTVTDSRQPIPNYDHIPFDHKKLLLRSIWSRGTASSTRLHPNRPSDLSATCTNCLRPSCDPLQPASDLPKSLSRGGRRLVAPFTNMV